MAEQRCVDCAWSGEWGTPDPNGTNQGMCQWVPRNMPQPFFGGMQGAVFVLHDDGAECPKWMAKPAEDAVDAFDAAQDQGGK